MYFKAPELKAHRRTVTHTLNLQSRITMVCRYGCQPLSPATESSLQLMDSKYITAALRHPFHFGVVACEDGQASAVRAHWEEALGKFDPSAGFKVIRFAAAVCDLIMDLPLLMFKLMSPDDDKKVGRVRPRAVIFEGSYAASDVFAPVSLYFDVHVIKENSLKSMKKVVATLTKEHAQTPFLYLLYEHTLWQDFGELGTDVYRSIRQWCSAQGVPMVCDETLTFLTGGKGHAFAYQRALEEENKLDHPDFVLVGKYAGVAAMVACNQARELTQEKTDDSLQRFIVAAAHRRTVYADVFTLIRSTGLLEWAHQRNVTKTGTLLSKAVPEELRKHGLPAPAAGGGFLWLFSKQQVKAMERKQCRLANMLDVGSRMRLYLDTTPDMIKQQARMWT